MERKKKTQKTTSKKTVKSKTSITDVKWYVLRGFKLENKDETGFLGINAPKKSKNAYKIVDSHDEAMKFPSQNIYGVKGFGTPKQWLEFFKAESELEDWKFHLMKIRGPELTNS